MTESITPSSAESTTAAVPTPREDLGVRLFSAPPADFDPLGADDRALVAFGYPPKPDQHKEPKLYAQWRRRVSRRSTRIEPVFVRQPGKVHGPMRGPSAEPEALAAAREERADATSTNWSGSVVFASSGDTIGWVEGEWTVPDRTTRTAASRRTTARPGSGSTAGGPATCSRPAPVVARERLQAGLRLVGVVPRLRGQDLNFPVSAGDTMFCLIS